MDAKVSSRYRALSAWDGMDRRHCHELRDRGFMGDFFHGWRRKFGCMTLMLSAMFMCGWMRSLVVDDFIEFPITADTDNETLSGLATQKQALILYWFSELHAVPSTDIAPTPMDGITPLTLYFEESEGKRFGDEHLDLLASIPNLTKLHLRNTATTEAGLKNLKHLKNLESLDLSDIEIFDAGIKDIIELKQLTNLGLGGTKLTDAGMKEINELENLTSLGLNGTKITNTGLQALKGLKKLTLLDIRDTQITDDGLKGIGEFTKLTHLFLDKTKITDAGLKEISGLKELRQLYLTDTKITDVGMKVLVGLTKLGSLELSGTNITDNGLKDLAGLTGLQWVSLGRTQTTKAGVKELKKSLPDLQVEVLAVAVQAASSIIADDTLDESEAIAMIKQLGGTIIDGRPRGISVTLEPVPSLVIPFWSIVIPLTLLSAYLLLSKPRSSKANNTVAPTFQEQP